MAIDYGYGISLGTLEIEMQGKIRQWRNHSDIYKACRQVGLITDRAHKAWWENGDNQHMFQIGWKGIDCIGIAGLTSVHQFYRTAEISLYVAPEYQQEVGARPIIKTLAAYAFEMLGLNRIFGDTFATNVHEIANLKELGFQHEGTLRQSYYKGGQFIDSVIQSMLRTDYEEEKKKWK